MNHWVEGYAILRQTHMTSCLSWKHPHPLMVRTFWPKAFWWPRRCCWLWNPHYLKRCSPGMGQEHDDCCKRGKNSYTPHYILIKVCVVPYFFGIYIYNINIIIYIHIYANGLIICIPISVSECLSQLKPSFLVVQPQFLRVFAREFNTILDNS